MLIKMTKEIADMVRGVYCGFWGLTPDECDGYWYLPADVMENPVYQEVHEILSQCETIEAENETD